MIQCSVKILMPTLTEWGWSQASDIKTCFSCHTAKDSSDWPPRLGLHRNVSQLALISHPQLTGPKQYIGEVAWCSYHLLKRQMHLQTKEDLKRIKTCRPACAWWRHKANPPQCVSTKWASFGWKACLSCLKRHLSCFYLRSCIHAQFGAAAHILWQLSMSFVPGNLVVFIYVKPLSPWEFLFCCNCLLKC